MTYEKKKIPITNNHLRRDGRHPGGSAGEGPIEPNEASVEVPVGTTPPENQVSGGAALADSPSRSAHTSDRRAETPEDEPCPPDIGSPLDVAIAERDAYLDSLLRLQAEFDNYRRRSQRESGEARDRARAALLTEFLPVLDNLARALDAAEHHEEGKVLEGVRLTHNLFAGLLNREGVTEICALGSHFDPHLHEAVVTMPSEAEEGIVVQVVEKGYAAGEKVLRPARVVVSSGSAVAETEEER